MPLRDLTGARPNILVLLTDSTRFDCLGCHGDTPSVTPHLDRLAAEGVRFTHAFATTPLCHPARAALLTGLYPHANGMIGNACRGSYCPRLDPALPTLAGILQGAGYRCGIAAQGGGSTPPWDDALAGYDRFKDRRRAQGHPYPEPMAEPGFPVYGRALPSADDVRDEQYVRDGLDLLRQYVALRQPWMLSIELDGPHAPCMPAQEWYDRIDPRAIRLPESLRDPLTDRADRYRQVRRATGSGDWDDATWREALRLYRAVVAMQDDALGRLLRVLKLSGRDQDTLVIFSSDHGDPIGQHGICSKFGPIMSESILHVPLVIGWPGTIAGGAAVDDFVCGTDWMPTFCELAGVNPPARCHGRSLAPLLQGERPANWRQGIACTYYGVAERWYGLRSYRDARYKYVFDPHGMDEFYDLQADPGERCNLIQDRRLRPLVWEYADQLVNALRAVDDPLMESDLWPVPGRFVQDGLGGEHRH